MPTIEELKKTLPKHERLDDLRSHADDPHPRKTRRVEWVGQMSPLDNPLVAFRMVNKLYTPLQEQAIRKAAAYARTRGEGHRIRTMDHPHPAAISEVRGLLRSYIFEPANDYTVDMDYHDYDIIFAGPDADEFRDLDDPNRPPYPWDMIPSEEEVAQMIDLKKVSTAGREGGIIART
jgi:hypothetical protein